MTWGMSLWVSVFGDYGETALTSLGISETLLQGKMEKSAWSVESEINCFDLVLNS